LREGVQQEDAREPVVVAIKEAAADAHRRNARHVGAVRESGAHHVELVFDAPPAAPDAMNVELALELGAAEGRVALRIQRFVEFAYTRPTNPGIAIAGIA